jgi:hypothetical protein
MLETPGGIENKRQRLALEFVKRPEFIEKYSTKLTAEAFVNAVLSESLRKSGVDISAERAGLLSLFDNSVAGTAAVLTRVVISPAFVRAEYNRTFVLMQYFAYLRRDIDEAGYDFWVHTLQTRSIREADAFRTVACAFLNSAEYQSRFGMVPSSNLRTSPC